MNPTMQIIHEVELPSRVVVRQIREEYENSIVGYRIVKSLDFKVIYTGGLFSQLKSDRFFAQATNIRGAVQHF
jgi:hypothetical protein